jgi:hypothetical protein
MRARARPLPVLRAFDQSRPYRVERHVTYRRREMLFVHDDRAEAALPEMTGALASRLNGAGITAVDPRQRTPQPVGIGRHQNEVHMVRDQTPGPHFDPGLAAMGGQQIAIQRVVRISEEGARAAIATLRDMVRVTGNDDGESIECTVTVIPGVMRKNTQSITADLTPALVRQDHTTSPYASAPLVHMQRT